MAEFEQKYNETMVLLQDAVTRLTDHLSLWKDEWSRLSDSEKSAFCLPSSQETVEPSPAEVAQTPPPPAAESCEAAETSIVVDQQITPSTDEDVEAAAAVPRASSVKNSRTETTGPVSCSEVECYLDDDDDDGVDASKYKKWNCYTVFIKEGLADKHLTKVRCDCEIKELHFTSVSNQFMTTCVRDLFTPPRGCTPPCCMSTHP